MNGELFGIGRTYLTAWLVMILATVMAFTGKIEVDTWSMMILTFGGISGGKSIAETIGKKKGS